LHNDLFQYLTSNETMVALFADRVYHMSLPTEVKTFPALTFQQISRQEEGLDMDAPNDEKMDSVLFQFDVVGKASQDAVGAADAFDAVFRNFRGTMGATKVQDVVLNNITQLEDREGEKLRRRVTLDYSITFNV